MNVSLKAAKDARRARVHADVRRTLTRHRGDLRRALGVDRLDMDPGVAESLRLMAQGQADLIAELDRVELAALADALAGEG